MEKRKPYDPPVLRRIELVVEEAVLAACKTTRHDLARTNKTCWHTFCKRTLGS